MSKERRKAWARPVPMAAGALLIAAGASICSAGAADLEDFLVETQPVLSKVLATRTVAALCQERDPARAEQIDTALAAWEKHNELRVFDALIAGLASLHVDLARQLENAGKDARAQIAPQLDDKPEECDIFDTAEEAPGDLRAAIRALALDAHAIDLKPRPGAIPDTVTVRTITELSHYAAEIMALVTPENAIDDDVADAREAFFEYYLDAWGYVAGYGRIEEGGDIREWRGDYQSRYHFECASFAGDDQEQRFAVSTGRDMIIVGAARYAHIRDDGGTISLEKCWVFEHDGVIDTEDADPADAGLMLRPLEMSEAFAGVMQGPKSEEIDRVLYDASFSSRMDGFGNGYVDRREAVYVLLRDGTAFRHDWSFPVTDIDLSALKRREPDKVFTWRDERGIAVLQAADGVAIRLEDAIRIVPIGNQARLDREYYYLQVGMGGRRSDRAYEFSSDGNVTYTSGGFVAGNFGTSYIIVSGGEKDAQKAGYRFEDYALIVETPEGSERRFFAVGADEDLRAPDQVIIEGTVYWLRD